MGANESMRDRLNALLDELGYDFSQFSAAGFAAWVARRRQRPIHLVPQEFPPDLDGAWLRGARADFVFYQAGPLQIHSVHILLHEISHILLGHTTAPITDDFARLFGAATQAPAAQLPASVQGLFRSIRYTDLQEVEAETLSSLIQQRVIALAGAAALAEVGQEDGLRHFVEGLGLDRY